MNRVILLLFLFAQSALGAFTYKRTVTFDHTKCGSANSTNFVALISVTDANLKTIGNGGHVQSSSGFDIRPYSDSGLSTALSFELDKYVAATGQLIMWVKIPTMSASVDTVIYLAYGDSSATSDGSDAASTWSASYQAVYHFGDGTTLSTSDSLAAHNGTNTGSTAATGQVNGGVAMDGNFHYITLATPASFPITTSFTVSTWTKLAATTGNSWYPIQWGDAVEANSLIADGGNGGWHYGFTTAGDTFVVGLDTNWNRVSLVFNGTTCIGYKNGVQQSSDARSPATPSAQQARIGIRYDAGNLGWNGSLDELTISNTARNADWILTEFNNQNNPGTFETLGTEGSVAPSTTSVSGTGTTTISGTGTTTISP